MGQAADDLIEGMACSHCGTYFEQEHGYPVLCKRCHKRQSKGIKSGNIKPGDKLPVAKEKELGA